MSRNPRSFQLIDVGKSASHYLSQDEIGSDNPCPAQPVDATLFYSVDPIVFFKETRSFGLYSLNLNRAVFSLNQRSRTNLAIETPADWTSGRCCVDPLRPPLLSISI